MVFSGCFAVLGKCEIAWTRRLVLDFANLQLRFVILYEVLIGYIEIPVS